MCIITVQAKQRSSVNQHKPILNLVLSVSAGLPPVLFAYRIRTIGTLRLLHRLVDASLNIGLHPLRGINRSLLYILDHFTCRLALDATLPVQDTRDLHHTDAAEEEVDGGEQVVLWLDDETPAGPDGTGGGQGGILCEGELLRWAVEVGDTCDNKSPLGG